MNSLLTATYSRQVAISSIIHIYDRQMPICLKALDFQGLFRISGVKNVFHFYGCEIPTSETRTSDLLPKIRANNC